MVGVGDGIAGGFGGFTRADGGVGIRNRVLVLGVNGLAARVAERIAAALPGAAGCFWTTTKSEGQALRRDVDSLDKRIAGKEADLSGKIAELKAVLDDATKLLKRNSADLGADVDGLRDDIRKATGLTSWDPIGVTLTLNDAP